MSEHERTAARLLVASVTATRARALEEAANAIAEELQAAHFTVVRNVVVKAEPHFIQQLVSNVSTDNDADAIILVGGAGIGPRDTTCEALDSFFERRIEGFGDAYRRMLAEQFETATRALLARATAGVYNQCVVFALAGSAAQVRRAMQTLVIPILPDAVDLATGRLHTHGSR